MAAAAGLLLVFAVYCFATQPLIPRPIQPKESAAAQPAVAVPEKNDAGRMAERWLTSDAPWAATSGFQSQAVDDSTFFYFESWKQESKKVVRFQPFALISKRANAKPGDAPYTIVSDAAYVTFEKDFDFAGGSPGAIVRAGLEGAVHIRGPHDLEVRGQDFYFEREAPRIYSDRNVWFRVAAETSKTQGTALGVQIELIRDAKAKPSEPIAIAGISSVKLLQNVDLKFAGTSADQLGIAPRASSAVAPPKGGSKQAAIAKRPVVAYAHCDGSFNFVLATHVATFERNVGIRAESDQHPGKFDSLFADDMVEMTFDVRDPKPGPGMPPTAAGPAIAARKSKPKGQNQASGDLDVNLQFKKIHAQGKTVQLLSEANDVHAEMRELDYDQTTREAILTAAPKSVQAYQKANHLHAPRITLKQSENGNDVTDIRCIGQGGLEHHDDKTKEVDLIAEWRKEMHKYPDPVPKSTFDLVDFEEAVIWQPKEPASEALGIAANHLRVWVKRQQADRQAIAANRPLSAASPQNGPQIDHLLALQNVAVVSPQLEAETEHLEIWFEAGSLPGGGLPGSKKPIPAKRGAEKAERERRPRTHLLPTAGRVENKDSAVMPLFASPVNVRPNGVSPNGTPGASKPNRKGPADITNPGKSKKPGGPPAEPYRINAAKINVRVLQGKAGEQPQVAEVVSQGNVHLTQPHGEDAEALAIDGNDLHVENHGGMDQDMVVLGQPAHVRNQGAHIEGNQIRFNRLKNAADVDGLGKMQLPLKSSKPADETADGGDKPALPLDVDWHNGMHFDGRTATFDGMVRSTIDDGQAKSEIRCRDMQVTLTKRFSFTEERHPGDQPEIDTIVCRGGVEFESDSTTNPKLMEIRRGQFVQLVMHRATGKAEGIGPGVLRVWRRGEHGNSGLGAISSARSNAPPKERKSTSWQFIQVTFNGHMDGDFSHLLTPGQTSQVLNTVAKTQSDAASNPLMNPKGEWTTTFHDHVQVLYGPVDQPMDIIIRDDLQEGCGWLGCDHLEIAQQAQSATADQHMTLVSRGDAKIEGKSFNGEAETITYDGSTGLYVLHGGEDGYATLYRQLKVGGPLSKSMQGVLRFKPDTNTISADQAVDIDAINGPAPPKKNDAKTDKTPKARKKSRFGR